jgi:aromatic ring-opening dioxygenase catalytic subunit (LigB family)
MGMQSTPDVVVWQSLTLIAAPTPVHFFSHGSTMMLGEESESATYWKKAGDEALANGIKGVIMMVGAPTYLNELI